MADTNTSALETAMQKAATAAGLGAEGVTWMKAIRAAESGTSTNTSIGNTNSSAKGLWQFTSGTWTAVASRIPASYGVPKTFSTDVEAQAMVMAWSLKEMKAQGYTSDPRLIYLYHFSPEVASKTKKKMTSGTDFWDAYQDGLNEALTTGRLGQQYSKYRKVSDTGEQTAIANREVIGGMKRFGSVQPGVVLPKGNMVYNQSKLTDGSGGGVTYASAGGGEGQDIVVNQVVALTSGPSANSFTPTKVIQEGLNVPAWNEKFATGNGRANEILVGNPKLVAIPARGVFQMWLDEKQHSPLSTNFGTDNTTGQDITKPVEVRLNVSLKSMSVKSRHVIHKKPTRTGFHLTFWGMEPDLLSGSGTTGLFLNQFGPASVMSLADGGFLKDKISARYQQRTKLELNIRAGGQTRIDSEHPLEKILTSDIKPSKRGFFTDLVSNAFSDFFGLGGSSNELNRNDVYSSDTASWSDRKSRYGSGSLLGSFFPSMANSAQSKFRKEYTVDKRLEGLLGKGDTTDALRVPAQDAFNELLQLFKQNGQMRFHSTNYDESFQNLEQTGTQEWSDGTGLSGAQANARNNDVFSRGILLFRMKGTTYFGYFKSLNFTMNANTPFTWDFDFSFQVLRTTKAVYVPELFFKGV